MRSNAEKSIQGNFEVKFPADLSTVLKWCLTTCVVWTGRLRKFLIAEKGLRVRRTKNDNVSNFKRKISASSHSTTKKRVYISNIGLLCGFFISRFPLKLLLWSGVAKVKAWFAVWVFLKLLL